MVSFTASWTCGVGGRANPLRDCTKNKKLYPRGIRRECLVAFSTCSSAVSTTKHKDGTITYHFSEEAVAQDAPFTSSYGRTEVVDVLGETSKALLSARQHHVDLQHVGEDALGTPMKLVGGDAVRTGQNIAKTSLNGTLSSLGNSQAAPLQLDRAQDAKYPESSTASENGHSKIANGVSANGTHHLVVPDVLHASPPKAATWFQSPRQQVAGFSGRIAREEHTRTGWHQLPHNDDEYTQREGSCLTLADVHKRIADLDAMPVLVLFSDFANNGQLEAALEVTEAAIKAKRDDIVGRIRHRHFLRTAADQAYGPNRERAVKLAMRFVQVLPRKFTDARTYNMLVSVCVKARDLTQALHAADMLRSTGRKLDTILYTNLIGVCAAVGNADAAFELYAAMKAEGIETEPQVYTALISACSREILDTSGANRRLQLVLLERARGVLAEMRGSGLRPDAVLWNTLITAAGRAGQVQGAFQTLEDMQGSGCKADAHTYASLIDACARSGRADLAIRVYHKALRERCDSSLLIYATAIASCRAAKAVDLSTAMDIYGDMQRNGVQPDERLYATLMGVAGAAGDLELAFSLQDEMVMDGLRPSKLTQSALIQACIGCGALKRARQLYGAMQEQGRAPSLPALNNLINAHARACRLGDVVSLVQDLVAGGMKPDGFTFAAVLNACQRANEAELAFEVYRIMKQRGHTIDEALCFILVRLCYNRLRKSWYPGGYPPKNSTTKVAKGIGLGMNPAGPALLRALGGGAAERSAGVVGEGTWAQRAVDVYREALSAGYKPRPHVIERVLACLRQPQTPKPAAPPAFAAPFEAGSYAAAEGHAVEAMLQSNSRDPAKIFDARAVAILEEAISVGALPQFSLANDQPLDLRHVPPCIAEVYVLAIVAAMQRGAEMKETDLTILVPPYDPAEIFFPSYGHDEPEFVEKEAATPVASLRSGRGKAQRRLAEEAAGEARVQAAVSQTGLGVAGMLRRIGLWTNEDAIKGRITVAGRELIRWLRASDRAASSARSASLSALQEQRWIGSSIASQQKTIRMGLNGAASKMRNGRGAPKNPRVPKVKKT